MLPEVEGRSPDFEYADDVSLLDCEHPSWLQPMATAACQFCAYHLMTINAAKCILMLMGLIMAGFGYHVEGEWFARGLLFDSTASAHAMAAKRAACIVSASHGVVSTLHWFLLVATFRALGACSR